MLNDQPVNNQAPVAPVNASKGTGFIGLMNSIPEKLAKILKKPKAVAPTAQTVPHQNQVPQGSTPQSIKKLPLNPKKLLLVGGGVLLIIIILSVVLMLMKPKGVALVATPVPTPVEPVATPVATKYATDSAILRLEENIKILDQNLNSTDLREETIQPRTLDWTISFK